MKKILFLDSVHEILRQKLEAAGYHCEYQFELTREQVLAVIRDYFGVVIRSRITIDKEFIDSADSLKFIARSGSGLENIDVAYAETKEIAIINSPEGNRDAVGEHAIGMLLMLFNKLHHADRDVREGRWQREKHRGHEIGGKTIGIIGYGQMGSSFAEKLSGFGCHVIAHDKYRKGFGSKAVKEAGLDEIYASADVVSLHLPQSSETHYYANDLFFQSFKKNIFFINTARGKNTETAALVRALKSGKVSGACLDVLEYEKASLEGLTSEEQRHDLDYLLIHSNNVVLTPHIAGWTQESYYKLSDVLAQKILALF